MRPMLTLTLKDLLLLWRNKAALFWVIVFPLAFGLFYGAIISRGFRSARQDEHRLRRRGQIGRFESACPKALGPCVRSLGSDASGRPAA